MNLPNQLTIARLVLTALFTGLFSVSFPLSASLATLTFVAAACTDFLDGFLARKRGQITAFGQLMDPLADKILMAAAFVLLTEAGSIPGWSVVLILTREFLVTGLRLFAVTQGVVLAADRWGKQKTLWQMILVLYFLLHRSSNEFLFSWLNPVFTQHWAAPSLAGNLLLMIVLALTLGSGISYGIRNRSLFGSSP